MGQVFLLGRLEEFGKPSSLRAGRRFFALSRSCKSKASRASWRARQVRRSPATVASLGPKIAIEKALGAVPLAVSLDVPRDDRYLLWIGLKAKQVTGNEKIGVAVDGARPVSGKPMWDYVTTGLDNPASIPFFDTPKSDRQTDPWYALKADPHRVELTLPTGAAEVVSLTVTNDAGYVPEGNTSFRHPQLPVAQWSNFIEAKESRTLTRQTGA